MFTEPEHVPSYARPVTRRRRFLVIASVLVGVLCVLGLQATADVQFRACTTCLNIDRISAFSLFNVRLFTIRVAPSRDITDWNTGLRCSRSNCAHVLVYSNSFVGARASLVDKIIERRMCCEPSLLFDHGE